MFVLPLIKSKKSENTGNEGAMGKASPEAVTEAKPKKNFFAFFKKKEKKEGIIEKFKFSFILINL